MARSCRALVALVALIAALSGCAGVAMDGRVRAGREVAAKAQEGYLRVLPAPPRPGDGPEAIVRGFLQASASFEASHAAAREFLTAQAAGSWRPDSQVTVYDSGDNLGVVSQPGAIVVLTAPLVGTIDSEGRYIAAAPSAEAKASFTLRQVAGQWRIDVVPRGVFLKPYDVVRAFRQVNLYFPAATGQILVPDPVFIPARRDLATALVARLLDGPTSWTAPAVRSAFPPGTALGLGGVQVGDGAASVDLTRAARSAGPNERRAIAAQLVWTLRQIRGVRTVSVTSLGTPLYVSGAPAAESVASLAGFDPDGVPNAATAYVERAGRVLSLRDDDAVTPVAGPAGDGSLALRRPAISPGGGMIAGLSKDGSTLYAGVLGQNDALVARLTGTSLSEPSWDVHGNLWVADRRDGTSQIWVLREGEAPAQVEAPELSDASIAAIRVARDGARAVVALTRDGRTSLLLTRVVVRSGIGPAPRAVRLEESQRLDSDLTGITDLAWASASSIVVLGNTAKSPLQVYLVDSSGWQVTQLGAIPATTVTAAPGRPVLVGGADGKVYQAAGRQWEVVGPGQDPAYPG